MHGIDGLEFEELDAVPIEEGTAPETKRDELEVLAGLWRERLAGG